MEVELVVSIGVVVVLTTILLQTANAYVVARKAFMLERTMRMAAQAQLDRYRAGFPLNSQPPEDLRPANVTLATETTPGVGHWSGMTRVTVTASGTDVRGRLHQIALSGYFKEAPSP